MSATYLDELRTTWLFSGCSNRELRAIASLCTPLDVEAGRVLIHEGDLGRQCFVVVDGHAVAERGHTVLGQFGEHSLIGGLALVDAGQHAATVTAVTPMTVLVIDRRAFASLASGQCGWSVQHRIEVLAEEQRRIRNAREHVPATTLPAVAPTLPGAFAYV